MHQAKFTLDVTPWKLIEFSPRPAVPAKYLCHRSFFRETVLIYSALAKLHLTSDKSSRKADKFSVDCVVHFSAVT